MIWMQPLNVKQCWGVNWPSGSVGAPCTYTYTVRTDTVVKMTTTITLIALYLSGTKHQLLLHTHIIHDGHGHGSHIHNSAMCGVRAKEKSRLLCWLNSIAAWEWCTQKTIYILQNSVVFKRESCLIGILPYCLRSSHRLLRYTKIPASRDVWTKTKFFQIFHLYWLF